MGHENNDNDGTFWMCWEDFREVIVSFFFWLFDRCLVCFMSVIATRERCCFVIGWNNIGGMFRGCFFVCSPAQV